MRDFAAVAAFCNAALQAIDPLQHRLLWDVWEHRMNNPNLWPKQPIFKAYNPTLLWECCEVVFNQQSPHRDFSDPHFSWACIVYFGTFRDVWFSFHRLGLQVQPRPGDVIFFRGKDLVHLVTDWGDGKHNFLIYFTHESAWRNVGLGGQCTSTPIHIP